MAGKIQRSEAKSALSIDDVMDLNDALDHEEEAQRIAHEKAMKR